LPSLSKYATIPPSSAGGMNGLTLSPGGMNGLTLSPGGMNGLTLSPGGGERVRVRGK